VAAALAGRPPAAANRGYRDSRELARLLVTHNIPARCRGRWRVDLLLLDLPPGLRLSFVWKGPPDLEAARTDPFHGWTLRPRLRGYRASETGDSKRAALWIAWRALFRSGLFPTPPPDSPEGVALPHEKA
jgi:hypothetical protein